MVAFTNRTGDSIRIILHKENGNKVEISSLNELGFLLEIARYNIKYMAIHAIKKIDLYGLYLLARLGVKKALGKDRDVERDKLVRRNGLDVAAIEIVFRERSFIAKSSKGMFFALGMLDDVFIKNQYDINEGNIRGKTIIDAGANTGFFCFMCVALGAKKIYAFEPVESTYQILSSNIKDNGLASVVVPVKKAVGDVNSTAKIKHYGSCDASASINLDRDWESKFVEEIEIVKIDDFLKGERVDFIKMDIEGYEEKAIFGAKDTIAKFKPVLSFSAYHKPDDKEVLPKTVLGIRSDYKIKLNKYEEEDFYCD